MKKIILCAIAVYLTANAFTQTYNKNINSTIDTLYPPSYHLSCYSAALESYAFDANSEGFITGSNFKGDTKYAQIYKHGTGTGLCTGILVDMTGMTFSGSGNIQAHIYNLKDHLPDSLLGSSVTRTGNSLGLNQQAPQQYFFSFSNPVTVNTDFAAAIELPDASTNQNFFASVVSTQIGCVPTTSDKRSCVYNTQSKQWSFLADSRSSHGRAMHVDLHIYPIIDGDFQPASIDKFDPLVYSISIYPNPATDILTVVSANKMEKLQIYNAVGQIVFEENTNNLLSKIDIHHLNSGNYIIKIQTNKGHINKKLLITK